VGVFGFKITYRTNLNTPPQLDALKIEVSIPSQRKIDHIIDDCLLASVVFLLLARIQSQSDTSVLSIVSKIDQ